MLNKKQEVTLAGVGLRKSSNRQLHAYDKKIKVSKEEKSLGAHLEFHRVLWEVFVGHEGRMLAAPLEQRGEPGLVL